MGRRMNLSRKAGGEPMNTDLYLDVDGGILGRDEAGREALVPTLEEILEYAARTYRCFWLTTQERGEGDGVVRHLAPHCSSAVVPLLRRFQVAHWDALKTEAVDFSRPFIWIDDRPLWTEIKALEDRNCLYSWLRVDAYQNLEDLTVSKIEAKRRQVQRMHPFFSLTPRDPDRLGV